MMDYVDDILLLLRTQRHALRDSVPLSQTAPTAGCRGMLGDKNRMAAQISSTWRLLTVIHRVCRRQPRGDKIGGMLIDSLRALIPAVLPLFRP